MHPHSIRPPQQGPSAYLLANAAPEASARFAALAELFDPGTVHHLEECNIGCGWHCLEVGAGGGSVARWLAERVGPGGRVLATDVDPRHLRSIQMANLEVRRHDVSIEPLPAAAFDLIHARLVLMHLPQREEVLARLISALRPGGWLVAEEYDISSLLADLADGSEATLLKTQIAVWQLLEDRGVSLRFGRHLFGRFRAHGLVQVAAEGRLAIAHHGSAGVSLIKATFEQLRELLISADYVSQHQYEQDLARLDDPDFLIPTPIMWAARGRRR
jgi:SAM-dependent methyltransferase